MFLNSTSLPSANSFPLAHVQRIVLLECDLLDPHTELPNGRQLPRSEHTRPGRITHYDIFSPCAAQKKKAALVV